MIRRLIAKIKFELQFNNTSYYTRVSDKVHKVAYHRILRKKVAALPPLTLKTEGAALTLAILANKKNFYESVAALYSFCFWTRDIIIHYHEDGTLTETEIAFLKKIFPGIVVFIRAEQNQKIGQYLLSKSLPACAQLRSHFIFSLRTFDMIIEKKTPFLLQIDSDVLFFSRPDELLDIIKNNNLNGRYNKDVYNMYSFDEATINKYISAPVLNNFNAGVFMHNFDESFFDFAEGIMQNEPQSATSWHLEQTLFAMYASRQGNFIELPEQYALGKGARAKGGKFTSKHYVHNTGYDLHKDFIYSLYPMFKDPHTITV